jgi:hypothetical protein
MSHSRRHVLFAFGTLALALFACKKGGGGGDIPGATGKFAGNYSITASQSPGGGASYSGSVAITQTAQSYELDWKLADGSGYKGLGVEEGSLLGVGWGNDGAKGVIVYKINGGELDGRWTGPGLNGKLGTEKLSGEPTLTGLYKIVSSYSPESGGNYEGSVMITQAGGTYSFRWNLKSGESYSGLGLREGNHLVVGWGPGASVVVYTDSGGKLEGKWAAGALNGIGSETLAKN